MKGAARCALAFVLLFVAAEMRGDAIWNIQLLPTPIAGLQFNQNVGITFDYATSQAGGVVIFARPMTGGALSPNYAAHPSPVYPTGEGVGTGYFTISSGEVTVDAIRFQMYNASQTALILEFFVPVTYHFSSHAIYNIVVTPESPASIAHNADVSLTYDYRTTEAGGVRIWSRPMSGDTLSPNYAAHGSPVYPAGTGSASGFFRIEGGDVNVDSIRILMANQDGTVELLELKIPVHYEYRAHSISNIQFDTLSPRSLALNAEVGITFNYTTVDTGGVRIFPRPFTRGDLTPNYAASGSPVFPVGSGAGSASFTILAGDVTIDSVRFLMTNENQTLTHLEYFVPVNYHYSAHTLANLQFKPTSPAYMTVDHNEEATFDYSTTDAGGALIFMRPFTEGNLSPAYAAHPSPLHAPGAGSGSGWFAITAGSVLVDQIRFTMLNAAQTELLFEWFLPAHLQYGNMALTGVDASEAGTPLAYELLQNYPNPFNPYTSIQYQVPHATEVRLAVFDMLGREVAVLVDRRMEAGNHEVQFDGRNLASGVYLYRIHTPEFVRARKLMILK